MVFYLINTCRVALLSYCKRILITPSFSSLLTVFLNHGSTTAPAARGPFALGAYLDASQLLQCSRVCRSWYEAFAPLIWEDLHVHTDPLEDRKDLSHSSIHARYISFCHPNPTSSSNTDSREPGPTDKEVGLSELLQSKGAWLRSLCYHGHGSTLQFSLGKDCTKLRSLSLKGPLPFLGNEKLRFSNADKSIRPLLIHGDGGGPYLRDYQERCKVLFRQNREHLQHLTLRDFEWREEFRLQPGLPAWNPLFSCGSGYHHLRSLSLIRCGLRGRELKALWAVGSTLETLTMESVQINIGHWMHRRYLRDKSTNSDQPKGQESDEDDDDNVLGKDRIFPQLRELKLHKPGDMGKVSEIMEYIVKECPRLQALEWREVSHGREFSYEVFADILEEGFWPHLSSIDIKELPWLQDSTLQRILKTYQQPIVTPPTTPLLSATSTPPQTPTSSPPTPLPWHYGSPKPKRQLVRTTLTRLDVPILHLYESTFDLIRPHFTTLRHINLLNVNTSTRTYVFEVLINCSTLEVLYSNLMTIGDFIDLLPDPTNNPPNNHDPTPGKVADTKANAGQEYREPKWKKPWICKNLQELHMVLDMGIDEPSFRPYMLTPYARPYTPRELHLASLFFQQLGKLTRLRVLDMGFHRYISGPRVTHTSVLPFQLCAGLSHLQSLRSLEVVQFRGRQDLNLWDLQWMLDYWPGLREIGGSPLSARVDPEIVSGENNTSPLIYHLEFARILRERGIKIIPWTTSYYHNTNCSHKKMSELDQECVARWRERMLLEAEEHKALGQGADLMGQSTD